MKDLNLENVKVDDLVRYKHCASAANYYSKVSKVTKVFIVLEDGTKFRKVNGWGTGYHNSCKIYGINDQEKNHIEDLQNSFYF